MENETNHIPSLLECLAAATETKALTVKDNAIQELPQLIKNYFENAAIYLAADENTYAAAGRSVEELLKSQGFDFAGSFIFPGGIHAEYQHVETLAEKFKEQGKKIIPLAVGSGTVNDLVKRAASEAKIPYCCIPTAASVDGYTAAGAALLYQGFKQTMPCEAPLVVAADTEILAKAPAYLSSSGFGDLAGKIIAGTDWLIADSLWALDKTIPGLKQIDGKAWAMVQLPLRENLKQSLTAVQGDRGALKTLFESLSITGFALQYMKDSRPVSGCEHLWSHVWEMENLSVDGIPVTHGHKVAMGTLAAAAFTECFFASAGPPLPSAGYRRPSPTEREAEVISSFAGLSDAADSAKKTALEKFPDDKKAAGTAEMIRDNWKLIRERVLAILPPYEELFTLLSTGGCPVHPGELNLSRERIFAAARKAQMIRIRYTVLDLAWDLGVFEDVLKRMEESPRYLS
jgi:glycerol-1-phosphate dehydrogenase [NAD(P)+]